jgi:lantibiotic modifying enzyme
MSGDAYLGYAHGAAGIADALLDLFEATGDERHAAAVRGAASFLARLAITPEGLPAASVWPSREGDPSTPSFWCHGATGIGLFLLRAGAAGVFPDGLAWAERAAWSAARTTRWAGPTQCHGLSGNIEFLLDCHHLTRDDAYLTEASVLASLLDALGAEREGRMVWPSESPNVFTPDYMVGYAGAATCFLRLSSPERAPLLRRRAAR